MVAVSVLRKQRFVYLQTEVEKKILRTLKTSFLLFHRAFQFTVCNGPTNALVCNETLIQLSHIKTLKTTQNVSIIS
jgi:hypothetical protein